MSLAVLSQGGEDTLWTQPSSTMCHALAVRSDRRIRWFGVRGASCNHSVGLWITFDIGLRLNSLVWSSGRTMQPQLWNTDHNRHWVEDRLALHAALPARSRTRAQTRFFIRERS
eukprot:6512468-Pyramimonas_sp.AAC.1